VKQLILATAGHVDHGKSALVQALTGTDPDRLPEEKARGITIDLGFAELILAGDDSCEPVHLGLVDVPGHEDFIKNMVAGVGSVDVALLVVAADDGWMPQTEEHLQILTYLGVRHAVVALTKADLAGDIDSCVAAIREKLRGSPFETAPIVTTSIREAASIERLRVALLETCAAIEPPREIGKPRLAVDRAFTLRGVGTVVTGTLTGGSIETGSLVSVQPGGLGARVRTMQSHGREVDKSGPGARVALNLADTSLARARGETGVRRGDVITAPGLGCAATQLDVWLQISSRVSSATAAHRLRSGAMVRLHHGTAHREARVRLLGVEELLPGQAALARLALSAPLFAFCGDRFLVRDSGGRRTLAGGIILDPLPSAELTPEQRTLLQMRAQAPDDLRTLIRTELARDHVREKGELLVQSPWSAEEIDQTIAAVSRAQQISAGGELVADARWWAELTGRARELIDAAHKAQPNRVGLEIAELRAALGPIAPKVADALIVSLCSDGFATIGTCIKRATHAPSLPPALQPVGVRIRAALAAKPLEPPSRKELAVGNASWQVLRFLLEAGEVVEIGPDLVMSAAAVELARERVRRHVQAKGPATASELREALATSRRVIIPLLERFDREGLTRRIGDKRVLR
jgi:selenocysteine-specific elongation factor